jgi:hypothetical protein
MLGCHGGGSLDGLLRFNGQLFPLECHTSINLRLEFILGLDVQREAKIQRRSLLDIEAMPRV